MAGKGCDDNLTCYRGELAESESVAVLAEDLRVLICRTRTSWRLEFAWYTEMPIFIDLTFVTRMIASHRSGTCLNSVRWALTAWYPSEADVSAPPPPHTHPLDSHQRPTYKIGHEPWRLGQECPSVKIMGICLTSTNLSNSKNSAWFSLGWDNHDTGSPGLFCSLKHVLFRRMFIVVGIDDSRCRNRRTEIPDRVS